MFFQSLTLLGGISLFLFGMKLMSEGVHCLSGNRLKNLLAKCTKNQFFSFLLGLLVTSLIQSSTAAIVLIAGLCDSKMINAQSARGCVIGAAVGTTMTGQLIRLAEIGGNFGIGILAPVAAVAGTVLMLFKGSETKNTGMVLMGLSVLFFSLITMKQSMEILCKEGIIHSFLEKYCDSSYAGITAGILLTALTSSCSASVGILQALCMSAKVSFAFVSAFVIGAMLGTVIPVGAVFASCRKTTKSLFWIYCLYAVFTCIIGTVAAAVFPLIYSLSVSNVSAGAAADFQTAARIISAILFLPALCLNRREQKPLRL